MNRSISENPKLQREVSTQLRRKEGFITPIWKKRIAGLYKSMIPSHIEEHQQVWLNNPEEIAQFVERIRDPESDLSSIEYICIVEALIDIYDIVDFFSLLQGKMPDHCKILYSNFNCFWAPLFKMSSWLGFSRNRPLGAYYRNIDLDCFADMSGLENFKKIQGFYLPIKIPVVEVLFDRVLAKLPLFRIFALNTIFISRKSAEVKAENPSVTVLIPCKNEEPNIEAAVKRMPSFGKNQEIVFIDDASDDGTAEKIKECQKNFPEKNILYVRGEGKGKGEAVRVGMSQGTGDICMILDADLTVIPEDLPQFYEAMKNRRADFIHGTRLIYPLEDDSMRMANIWGNIFFSILFTFILGQRTTDTLCGTKVFWRRDWLRFEEVRRVLKYTDLWGDYNLIFGASHYGLKISQLPVRYFERLEGFTKMNKRIKNALIMLRVSWYALWKIKFFC